MGPSVPIVPFVPLASHDRVREGQEPFQETQSAIDANRVRIRSRLRLTSDSLSGLRRFERYRVALVDVDAPGLHAGKPFQIGDHGRQRVAVEGIAV